MKTKLSLNIITKNAGKTLEKTLFSVQGLVDEIILVDENSSDETVNIAKKFKAKIFAYSSGHLGKQREYALSKTTGNWVLVLDSDEIISNDLKSEILSLKKSNFQFPISKQFSNIKYPISKIYGCNIPFQTHFLGKPLHYGGENYSKIILFRRDKVKVLSLHLHEKYEVTEGKVRKLKNPVYHYSYESIVDLYKKFTDYAIRAAKQKKLDGEKTSLEKIFIYPVHMFWARFVIDKGYKDGLFRLPLDIAFGYMEWLTYLILLILNFKFSIFNQFQNSKNE